MYLYPQFKADYTKHGAKIAATKARMHGKSIAIIRAYLYAIAINKGI